MLAEKVLDRDVTPASGTWALFPEAGGNMHRFVAGEETHCAFLDVLAPPYAPAEQRRCTYYKDTPYEPCRCKHCCSLARLTNRIGARCDHSHVSCLHLVAHRCCEAADGDDAEARAAAGMAGGGGRRA